MLAGRIVVLIMEKILTEIHLPISNDWKNGVGLAVANCFNNEGYI